MSWGGKYCRRLLGRNPGRSLLSLGLAALLAFAFGLVTVLRGIYGELYRQVEVRPVFTGLSYTRAQKAAESGYVRDPYYTYTAQNVMVEMDSLIYGTVVFTNRLDRDVKAPVVWAEGWDEAAFFASKKAVCLMNAAYAQALGKGLGDRIRINEQDWLENLSRDGSPFQKGETLPELRDRRRPFATVVGLIRAEQEDHILYVPVEANPSLSCLYAGVTGSFFLDIAQYVLEDYHRAAEFRDYAEGIMDGLRGEPAFFLDTSYADRIYSMYRLLETLYPLAVAAALLLGGVLPGLTVLHASREISILRALGVKTRKCAGIYTLAQVLCALVGLLLGFFLALLIQRPEPGTVMKPFGIYLLAHLVACAVGSGVFAWLCARKRVLEQLQAKE